jgi:NADPH-dependent 2,4-dienoyl-CoA reductase/sulfur reductase-like enzyme
MFLSTGDVIAYDKCVIASGARAKQLAVPVPDELITQVTTFNNVGCTMMFCCTHRQEEQPT